MPPRSPSAPPRPRRRRRSSLARRRILPAAFFARDTERVARELLGAVIECTADGVRTSGRIVETEAYIGEHDEACHASVGKTARTIGLWGPPGSAYVYRIYGMYWCANVVTRPAGLASAVLIRAVEPIRGIEQMWARRPAARREADLTSGPGRLCDALGITGPAHHGTSWVRGPLVIREGDPVPEDEVAITPRIGLNPKRGGFAWPLRWIVRDNPFVSARAETARYLRTTTASCR
jgi:DNA-3-methyladenine glycosylase